MSEKEFKKLTRNEMEKFIKTNLDSFIIFMYVQNLEEELDKKDKIIKEIAKELVNHVGTCPADYSGNLEEKCKKCNDTYEKCWIEYFEKKVDR